MRTLLLATPLLLAAHDAPPASARYRVEQRVIQEVDGSKLGQPKATDSLRFITYVTVTVDDSAGGRTVRALMDSLAVIGRSPFPQPLLDSLRASEYRAVQGADGKLGRVQAVRPSGLSELAASMVARLFPTTRRNVKAGDGWADTTEQRSSESAAVTRRSITTYKVAGEEAQGARKGLRLDGTIAATTNGVQGEGPQRQAVDGTGSGEGKWIVDGNGLLLGATITERMVLRVSGGGLPEPIPVTIVQETTVTPLD